MAATPLTSDLLILPPSVARNREHGSKVLKCLCCGAEWPLDHPEKFGRHVRQCSEAHADEMEAEVAERESNYYQSVADKELYAHLRKGGN
jgi:hypothetical protein